MNFWKHLGQRIFHHPWDGTVLLGFSLVLLILGLFLLGKFFLFLHREVLQTKAYEHSWFWDGLFPSLLLFLFPILWCLGGPGYQSPYFFGGILVIHLGVLLPLLHHWGSLRQWWYLLEPRSFLSPGRSIFLWDLSWALVYPYLWGWYFSWIRYSRLGESWTLPSLPFHWWDFLPLIFLFPYVLAWLLVLIPLVVQGRSLLWERFSDFYFSLHLLLLRLPLYFHGLEKLFKFHYLFQCFFLQSLPPVDPGDPGFVIRWCRRFYHYPSLFTLVLWMVISLEYLAQGSLYLSLYALFFYPIVWSLFSLFQALGRSEWDLHVSLSDYIYGDWTRVHYPCHFWRYFRDPLFYYGKEISLDPEVLEKWLDYSQDKLWHLRKVSGGVMVHDSQLQRRVSGRSFGLRLASSFRMFKGIRWMYTKPLHPACASLTQNIWDRFALLNSSWTQYAHILKAEKSHPSHIPEKIYSVDWMNQGKSRNFCALVERNTLTNFQPLVEKKVSVEVYQGQILDSSPQKEPDVVLRFLHSLFPEQRTLGMDMKNQRHLGLAYSLLLPISLDHYLGILHRLQDQGVSLLELRVQEAYASLAASAGDFARHQQVWASVVHHFPAGKIPPLRISHHFQDKYLLPEFQYALRQSILRMVALSDYLYGQKITQDPQKFTADLRERILQDETFRRILDSVYGPWGPTPPA